MAGRDVSLRTAIPIMVLVVVAAALLGWWLQNASWQSERAASPAPATFALWEVQDDFNGTPTPSKANFSRIRLLEDGLDRVACELIQTKHATSEQETQKLQDDLDRGLVSAGSTPARAI